MHESILDAFREMRPILRKRWEFLLRAEPVRSPLATPEALVYLMDWTLDQLYHALRGANNARRRSKRRTGEMNDVHFGGCECGLNPLLPYFASGERAVVDGLLLPHSPLPPMTPGERDACAMEVRLAMQAIARREIETFCAMCQRRPCAQLTAGVASTR